MKSVDEALAAWLRLLAVQQSVSLDLGAALESFHIGLADYEVLFRVVKAGEPGIRMRELASRVFLTDSGLTRLVERLEKQGLLRRRAAEGDQRGRTCTATPVGVALLQRAQPAFFDALEQAFRRRGGLTREELVALGSLLGKVATTVDADEHAAVVARRRRSTS